MRRLPASSLAVIAAFAAFGVLAAFAVDPAAEPAAEPASVADGTTGDGTTGDGTTGDTAPTAGRASPPGELGRIVRLGEEIVRETGRHPLSKPFVGNALNCESCHLDAGTDPRAGSFLGTATAYPAWSPRERRVITLEDRVAICFMRSMNGVRPPNGGEVAVAVAAYITWLSEGERIAMNAAAPLGPNRVPPLATDPAKADAARGAEVYAAECAACHGDDGAGGDDGPPVWGATSYNDGAGLARPEKLAAWVKVAMPLGEPHLSDRDALDVAAYVDSKPRPKFVLEDHLPPDRRGGSDAAPAGDRR